MTDYREKIEALTKNLPDAEGAVRFFSQFAERSPAESKKLAKNTGLLSDVLTVASFSPLLAATLLQNPAYVSWLARQRAETKIRATEELLEALARFSLTNSQVEPQILLSRFRRRELLRIYLRDIRRLGTIAETTEDISNLADAVLEYALRIARQELDNRYGIPLENDRKGRAARAKFCVVSLGKLGSRELNYASDIDLLFLYSTEGNTSGQGSRGSVSNREYFVKLAEQVTKIVGQQTGEGAAYRVDLRLRPHGRAGALAVSLPKAVGYYQKFAQAWERQTLIRARASAGETELFKDFYSKIESSVYSTAQSVEGALQSVKLSKEKINLEHNSNKGFNVKLGKGGIREIEFVAQALQLAYGGRDPWLRAPHTLISLARLADRRLLTETEATELFGAYDFLRRLEHRLQMEHGLQTHLVPQEVEKRSLVARRMNFHAAEELDDALNGHTSNVSRVFGRIFGGAETGVTYAVSAPESAYDAGVHVSPEAQIYERSSNKKPGTFSPARIFKNILASAEKSEAAVVLDEKKLSSLERFCETSFYFGERLSANPALIAALPNEDEVFREKNYAEILHSAVSGRVDFKQEITALRIEWTKLFLEIAAFDVFEKINLSAAKKLQTDLAEAALQAALSITEREIKRRLGAKNELRITNCELRLAVLGLGKLGGRGMDYGSDLDLVLIYDDEKPPTAGTTHAELYSRAAEILVTALSAFTRAGHLYRVDLRLRPDGKNGATSMGKSAFLNYLKTRSAVWEWLAYVKLRGVSGDSHLASVVEEETRKIAHENALKIDKDELKSETRRVRDHLEREKTRGSREVNIKYGAGGLLDVYFAARFLQLRDNVPDEAENRSTQFTLKRLSENASLSGDNYSALVAGHSFLNSLDHNLRLTIGRSNQLPLANKAALQTIVTRMKLESIDDLFEKLSLHRLEIRSAFENILS